MGTLDELLTINDDDFEHLVVLYLRRREPALRGLIHTGLNAEGKPIKCPVDAVLEVVGPPRTLIHVAATIHKPKEIKRKWLGGKKGKYEEPGDIAKASTEFAKWPTTLESKQKLYLAWNHPLENDVQLYRDVKARCESLNMEVDVIEASQLVDFLDHDPEGQYLREEFLKIDALRLSESLLRKIAARSLHFHRQTFGAFARQGRIEIQRDASSRLEQVITRGSSGLIGLAAPSGAGKSTLIHQCGVKLNADDVFCFWVPAEDLESNISPATLLLRVFRRFHPALNEHAGEDALEIAEESFSELILLVDDVNRLSSPHEALEAMRMCSRFDAGESKKENQPRIRFVVPMWPSRLTEQPAEERRDWDIVQLDFYSRDERKVLAGAESASQEADVLLMLDNLGGDPFLCELALSSLARHTLSPRASRSAIIPRIVDDLLTIATAEAARSRNDATQDQFSAALDRLVECALNLDDPEPSWDVLAEILGERDSGLLLGLSKTNRVGWVEERLSGSFWRWKHDRLRDALIGRWLAGHACSIFSVDGTATKLIPLMTIPGIAEAWGWAFAFTDSAFHCRLIDMLGKHQPLALASSSALIEFDKNEVESQLVNNLRHVLEGYSLSTDRFVESPRWPVLHRLTQTNNPLVIQITENSERNWHINFGRFRNGETHAGLRLMERFFSPLRINFPLLERATEEYARLHENRRTEIATQLLEELQDPTSLIPVLGLCGYLRWEELSDLAWNAWNAVGEDDKQRALLALIWALSRCGSQRDQPRLEEALLRARMWSNEDEIEGNTNHASERYRKFVEPLHFMLSTEITEAASETIARVATTHDDLRSNMLYVLRGIDMPATMEAYVRLTAEFGGSWRDQIEASESHDNSGRHRRETVPVKQSTRDRLWQMIEGNEPHDVRKVALWHWKRFVLSEDLKKLQSINENDAVFDEILQVRLRLRDHTAAPLLLHRIDVQPGAWLPYCYLLYNEQGLADALFKNLETALQADPIERQYVERIPQNLPADGIRRLLAEKRDLLVSKPGMWNSLWRSDVPEALEFLRQVFSDADSKDLERFATGSGNSYPVSERMLDVVAPVLHRFSEASHYWLITLFINAGRADSLESHGLERKVRAFKGQLRCWLNEADGRKVLNAAARSVPYGPQDVRRSANYFDIERQSNSLSFDSRKVLRKWIEATKKPNNVVVAGMLLAQIGTGEDLQWWYQLEPDRDAAAHEIWSDSIYILRRRRWQKHD
jgi:hypothetical protein